MPYWQLLYHCVWSTLNREPLLTHTAETEIFNSIRSKAIELEAIVFALYGAEDHVHLVAAIPPKIAVAKFIGQVKAVSSMRYNKAHPDQIPFFWQEEYGVFSFDQKRLPNYVAYVENQKRHHVTNTTIPILERMLDRENNAIRESKTMYEIDESAWRKELEKYNS